MNRQMPGLLQVGRTLLRVLLVAAGAGLGVYLVLGLLPLASMSVLLSTLAAAGVLAVGALAVLPFILPEIRALLRLG